MTRLFAVLCALAAAGAHADTLADVKAALNRLGAKAPVRATFAVDQNVKAAGKFANKASTRSIAIEVAHDQNGLTVVVPQALVEKAKRDEAAESQIDAIRAMEIVDALDYHAQLLRLVGFGTVAEERRVMFRGKPARQLVLNLKVPPKKEGNEIVIGSVKKAEDRLTLWVGDDNLPLAAERSEKTTAGFLFFHGDTISKSSYTFAPAGDRLVIVRFESTGSGSGMGQTVNENTVQTVTLH